MKALIMIISTVCLLILGCNTTEPVTEEIQEKSWQSIPEFADLDVRYIIKNNDKLYIAAVNTAISNSSTLDRGVIMETSDAISWKKIKGFHFDIGPLAFHGDTLFCLSDSLYRYHPQTGWKGLCKYDALITSDPASMGDMIFFKDKLYVMQSVFSDLFSMYRLSYDGTYESLNVLFGKYAYGGAKFIKVEKNGNEELYIRPNYFTSGFYRFDGSTYSFVMDGLSANELNGSPINSLAVRNDTLFAGFKYPATIKVLVNNKWQLFADSLPVSKSALLFRPQLRTETTAIVFVGNRMFVATNTIGVLEWSRERGWSRMSKGLVEVGIPNIEDVYDPVVFLEYFKGHLIAAYGTPGFGQWGGNGAFIYTLN
ncbi:MAG: hypothetical protein Q8933_13770 [Bacteroidota bacterium]|nr:hypothetical protein [Bacteroidota bacterium]MDP4197190.1 hypothetical protein [Bacteroidota bacterium]